MKFSSGFVAELTKGSPYYRNLANGILRLYSGSEPATADAAATGTLLAELTNAGGAWTAETRAIWKITLSGGSGSVNTIKIAGVEVLGAAVNFLTDLTVTAAAVAAKINDHSVSPQFVATSSGAIVYIYAPFATGTAFNSLVCITTATTMSATVAGDGTPSGSGGTAGIAAVNGLNFQFPAVAGVFTKETAVWQDSSANASGGVGYARLVLDGADDAGLSTVYRRVQFSVGTSGADITSSVLTTTLAAPCILNTFTFTVPTVSTV